ncbi:DUF1214 domain-containing protein [Paraburkholderia sp. GAS42]|uniref:DUF1214 domain-containing protein n=1 Tax=Paraburkholderia sp. GAS42 TaxID=3035135 RepID=UPI003D19E1ED
MDAAEHNANRKAATWLTATVLASIAAPILAKPQTGMAVAQRVAAVPAPVAGYSVSEAYVRLVARQIYVWAWPMLSMYNRVSVLKQVSKAGRAGGVVPVAPVNRLAMLHDYVDPHARHVACPDQDVVSGSAMLDLDASPVVIQVPDFGERFWIYQLVDMRTDGFAALGQMYATKPGFYLVVGPHWQGTAPKGINKVLRATTSMAAFMPRVFMEDTHADRVALRSVINLIAVYPLADYDGAMKKTDWSALPSLPAVVPATPLATVSSTVTFAMSQGEDEIRWVMPEHFLDQLPLVLDRVPPLPGEDAFYTQARALLHATQRDATLKAAAQDEAVQTETDVIAPAIRFSAYGTKLAGNWTTLENGAAFGTDYYTRMAAAKSNIFVTRANEARYFYLDDDASGVPLNGANAYAMTFPAGRTPPVKGFWSLTLYDARHFLSPNIEKRYSLGTRNRALHYNEDGSLTLYIQSTPPTEDRQPNWLPAPEGKPFSLSLRAWWPPADVTTDGTWTPPPVTRISQGVVDIIDIVDINDNANSKEKET